MNILNRYSTTHLKRLYVYLVEFQDFVRVEPVNPKFKNDWVKALSSMITQKNLENIELYITRIFSIINWLSSHKVQFRQKMKENFFLSLELRFNYEVAEDSIFLVKNRLSSIEIRKTDLMFSDWFIERLRYTSNTLNYDVQFDPIPSIIPIVDLTEPEPYRPISDELGEEEALTCKICVSNKIRVVLTGCGHTFCSSCTTRFGGRCGMCRSRFTDANRVIIHI
jgi:hypothetical protein